MVKKQNNLFLNEEIMLKAKEKAKNKGYRLSYVVETLLKRWVEENN